MEEQPEEQLLDDQLLEEQLLEEAPLEEAQEAFDEGVQEEVPEAVEEAEEEEFDGEAECPEHLKDAVVGSLRLKRLLSRDDEMPGSKRRREENPEMAAAIQGLQTKWMMQQDLVVKHVLDSLSMDELKEIQATNYTPDRHNQWKSAAELLAKYVAELKERKMVGGSQSDVCAAFRHRWKFDMALEKTLRGLPHKDLRYVLNEFDGTLPLEDVIAQAAEAEVEESCTASALPEGPGSSTMGRFSRLELIDPLADCAVFGDANLTFALKVAKHRKALGHVGRVIGTTFEELETLRERYKEIDESIKILEDHYAEVYHGVDCTRIAIDPRFEGMENSLGAVYYNFPHSGAIQGFFDGHPLVNWRHENLMRLFFRALRSFVKPGGSVKVASNMSAVGVRYSYIVGAAVDNEFVHVETMPFLEWHLHRYGRSYGDKRDVYKRPDAQNNQSYNAQRAEADMVYCFEYKPSGDKLKPQGVRLPPSLKTLKACDDGPFKHLQAAARDSLATQMHKRFITEVSGTHVG